MNFLKVRTVSQQKLGRALGQEERNSKGVSRKRGRKPA